MIRLTLALLLGSVALRLPAQADDRSRPASDVSVTVLDSAALRSGRGRTLADFLAGRVPGLLVAYESGQPSAAPRIVSRTSYGNVGSGEPLLYVDGVLQQAESNLSGDGVTWNLPTFGWQMPVDEIEQVRVYLGPVAGTMLEFGASRGVVEVVTRRARDARGGLRTSIEVTGASHDPGRMRTVRRLRAGSPGTASCTIGDEADGNCTPGQTFAHDALSQYPLHRTAGGIAVHVEGRGQVVGTRFRASAFRSEIAGTLPASGRSMSTLALSLEPRLPSAFHVALDARVGAMVLGVEDRLLYRYLESAVYWSPSRPDFATSYAEPQRRATSYGAPGRTGDRATFAARAQYRVGPSTRLSLHGSLDRVWRASWDSTDLGGPLAGPRRAGESFAMSTTRFGASVETGRSFGSRLRADLVASWGVTGTLSREDWKEEYRNTSNWMVSTRTGTTDWRYSSELIGTRVRAWDRLAVSGSLRRERANGAVLGSPLGSASAEYEVLSPRSRGGIGAWVVGGYGESIDHRTCVPSLDRFDCRNAPERTSEREYGLRLTRGARMRASVLRSLSTVTDGLLLLRIGPQPPFLNDHASWRVDATTLAFGLHSAPGARDWRVDLSLMRRDHQLTRGATDLLQLAAWSVRFRMNAGSPLDELVAQRYAYSDANGDGILAPSEITALDYAVVGHSEPRTIITSGGSLQVWGSVRVGAVLEARLGHQALDELAYARCAATHCAASYDSTASIDAQAAAFGMQRSHIHDAGFVRIRELHVEAAPAFLRGGRVRLAAHQLLAWTAFPGADPEANPRFGAMNGGQVRRSQPLYPSVSLRLDFDR